MLDCNVTIKGHQGAIEIAKQENTKTDKCAWTIVALKGNTVNITFTSLQLKKYKYPEMMWSYFRNYTFYRSTIDNAQSTCNNSQLIVSIINLLVCEKCNYYTLDSFYL